MSRIVYSALILNKVFLPFCWHKIRRNGLDEG